MDISIEKVNYQNKKDARILEATLAKWFKNPKELNLVDPNMSYPFRYNKWVSLNYLDLSIQPFILKVDKWIVGIGSINSMQNEKKVEIFHFYIDIGYRRQGLGKKVLHYFESFALEGNADSAVIRLLSKNIIAKKFLNSEGYIEKDKTRRKIILFQKKLK